MACLGTGKIRELGGLRDAFELVRARGGVSEGIIRIIAQEASGRIGVRNGRFIIGAHIGSTGLSGYAALKTFLALKRGMYYYLEGEEAGGITDLEQALGVDVTPLIFAEDGRDLLARFSQLAQENGWDCITEVYTNATPSTDMAAYQAPPKEWFGDTLLDKIAWAAKSTWQRVTALGKRFDPRHNENAARVFRDLDSALSQGGAAPPSVQPAADPSQDHIRAWQITEQATAQASPGILPAPGGPGSSSIQPPAAPANFPPAPANSAPSNIPPAPASFAPPTPSFAPPTPSGMQPVFQSQGAPSQSNVPTFQPQAAPNPQQQTPDLRTTQDLPPNYMPGAANPQQQTPDLRTTQDLPPNYMPGAANPRQQMPDLRTTQDLPPNYMPGAANPQQQMPDLRTTQDLPPNCMPGAPSQGNVATFQPNNMAGAPSRSNVPAVEPSLEPHTIFDTPTLNDVPAFQPNAQAVQTQAQPQVERPEPPQVETPVDTAAIAALAVPKPSADGIPIVESTNKHRQFAMSPRATNERVKAYSDRIVESQGLRLRDVEKAIEEADSEDKPPAKFDLAAILLVLVVVGLLVVGYFAFVTISYVSSGEDYLQRAQEFEQKGKRESALNEYTIGLSKRPGDNRFLAARASLYEKGNEFEKALRDYEAIIAAHPNDIDATLYAAMLHCRLFQFNDSLAMTTKILETDPQNQNALALHGVALAGNGEYSRSLEYLNKVDDDSRLAPYVMACADGARGLAYMNTNEPEKALKCYQAALKVQPKNDGLHRETAMCYVKLNDLKSAIAELKMAIELNGNSPQNYSELAKVYDQLHDFDDAVKIYKLAIKQDLRNPVPLYVKLAEDNLYLGRYGNAVEACNDALQFDPVNKQASLLKEQAIAKAKSGKPIAVAIGDLHAPVPTGDQNAAAIKGCREFQSGHYRDAANLLGQAVKANPADSNVRRMLAHALLRAGNKNAAYDQFVWLASGKNLPLRDTLVYAELCEQTGHPERALTTLSECLEQQPTWVDARVRMIHACIAAGLADRAASVAEEGIARSNNPDEKRRYEDALNAPVRKK